MGPCQWIERQELTLARLSPIRKSFPDLVTESATSAEPDRSEIGPYPGGLRAASGGGQKSTVSDGVKTNETCDYRQSV